VHIVVPRERLPLQQSVYFDVKGDKRMIFAIPRGKVTYLGTTDTNYGKTIDVPEPTTEDVNYILTAVNYMFPNAQLHIDEVQSSWSGLRPLIHQDGKSVSELSRKDEVFVASSGLISIAGGKLTGYRTMAEKVVDKVCKQLNKKLACPTKNLRLSGGDFDSNADFDKFINLRCGYVKQIEINQEQARELAYRYGANLDLIIEKAFELHATEPDPKRRLLLAELWYVVEYEQVLTLCDFLIRRSGRLYFDRPALADTYLFVANALGKMLNWSEQVLANNIAEFELEYERVLGFRG
jgi:glycerol-3-phosphate dehydrogenase